MCEEHHTISVAIIATVKNWAISHTHVEPLEQLSIYIDPCSEDTDLRSSKMFYVVVQMESRFSALSQLQPVVR